MIIRHNLNLRQVSIDFKFYRLLENIQDKIFGKFGDAWVSLLLEKSIFFSYKYAFYVLAYYSVQRHDKIMIYTSFDCVSSPKENEVSMNNIE